VLVVEATGVLRQPAKLIFDTISRWDSPYRMGLWRSAGRTPSSRKWQQDTKRVGLIKTMLTALLAKMVGYTGPIGDREKTEFSISDQEVPSWWSDEDKPTRVCYRGSGTPTLDESRGILRNLQET